MPVCFYAKSSIMRYSVRNHKPITPHCCVYGSGKRSLRQYSAAPDIELLLRWWMPLIQHSGMSILCLWGLHRILYVFTDIALGIAYIPHLPCARNGEGRAYCPHVFIYRVRLSGSPTYRLTPASRATALNSIPLRGERSAKRQIFDTKPNNEESNLNLAVSAIP